MAKCATSCEEVNKIWMAEGQEIQDTTQALVVDWNEKLHTLSMDSRDILDKTRGPQIKRELFQTTAQFYDPLGLFSPVSAIWKILFQESWCRGIQGEKMLLHDNGAPWHARVTSLPHLADIHTPRWLGTPNANDRCIFCMTRPKGLIDQYCTSDLRHGWAL
jgi:hypothetical protein